jgi:hypothetical protein
MLPMLIPLGQFLCCCLCAHARMASSQGETDSGKLQPVQTDAATDWSPSPAPAPTSIYAPMVVTRQEGRATSSLRGPSP